MLPSIEEGIHYNFTADVYLKNGNLRVIFYDNPNILTEIWYNTIGEGVISLSAVYETVNDPRVRFTIYETTGNPVVFLDNLRLTAL